MVNGITWLISYCKKRSLGSVERTGLTRFTGFERQEHENDQNADSDVPMPATQVTAVTVRTQ